MEIPKALPQGMAQMNATTRVLGPANTGHIVSHLTVMATDGAAVIAELELKIYGGSEDNIVEFVEQFKNQLRQLMRKPSIATAQDMMEALTKGPKNGRRMN